MAAPCSKRRKLDDEDKSEAIHLPEDVIREILVRLPTKSILRLKSTCKTWYAIIRSRSFIKLHRRFHLHDYDDYKNRLFFYDQGKPNSHVYTMDFSSFQSTPVFDIGILLKALKSVTPAEIRVTLTRFGIELLPLEMIDHVFEPYINVLGPLSNGIYCVATQVYARTSNCITYVYSNAAFCNPATGDFKLISPPHVFKLITVSQIKHHYGFGSIIEQNEVVVDYKMVMIIQDSDSEWFKAFVYSQRRGIWKLICDSKSSPWRFRFQFPTITQDLDFLPQATLNGCCHWMTDQHSILQFDLTNEDFGLIPGPPDDDYINHHRALVKRPGVFVLNDHLAAIIIRYGSGDNICDIDVWMMKEYGVEESWAKIQSCEFQLGGRLRLQKFLGMFFSRDITIERMFFQVERGELLSYDCFGRSVKMHSISSHILKKDSVNSFSSRSENDNGYSVWSHLEPLLDVLNGRSLACWKTIGVSAYVETLEPVALDMDEDTR